MLLESSEGTPAFLAPETYRPGAHDGAAADIWSLGVTLYLTLCGQLPFPWRDERAEQGAEAEEATVGAAVETAVGAAELVVEAKEEVVARGWDVGSGEDGGGGGGSPTLAARADAAVAAGADAADGCEIDDLETAVCTLPLRFPAAARLSPSARRLLERMLHKAPEDRATLSDLAADEWMTNRGEEEPVALPLDSAPLRATPEEIALAIAIRSPGLDLASCASYAASARGAARGSRMSGASSVGGSTAAQRPGSHLLRASSAMDFPLRPR